MSQGFIQIPRSLLQHATVRSCPDAQFRMLICIIENAVFLPCQFDDHGKLIQVLPGQFCTTLRDLAKLANIEKNDVERGLKRFFQVEILRHEVRHTKTIITITHKDTYDLIKSYSETRSETKVRQERDKSETQKDNVDNAETEEKKKKKLNKEKPVVEKILIREWVALTQTETDKIFHLHGPELANSMLDILDAFNTTRQKCYPSDYGALKRGGWVHKEAEARKNQPKPYNPRGNQNAARNQSNEQTSGTRSIEDDGPFKAKRTLNF